MGAAVLVGLGTSVHVAARDRQIAFGRCLQPNDQARQRAFSAARFADNSDKFILVEREIDRIHGGEFGTAKEAARGEALCQARHFKDQRVPCVTLLPSNCRCGNFRRELGTNAGRDVRRRNRDEGRRRERALLDDQRTTRRERTALDAGVGALTGHPLGQRIKAAPLAHRGVRKLEAARIGVARR